MPSIGFAWHLVAGPGELSDGEVRRVVAGGAVIALARHGDKYRALDDRCPHAGGPLSEGSIDNGLLVCPWHGREYDLDSGQCDGFAGVATYPVEVRAEGVFVAA